MSGPFVSNEMFPIDIEYVEKSTKSGLPGVIIVRDEETRQRYKGNVKKISTQWVVPNWKESNMLVRDSYKWDPIAGEKILDWNLYRTKILDTYMKAWDITQPGPDGNPHPVPCIPENIAKLQPSIAGALVDAFMLKTSPTEEEMGN